MSVAWRSVMILGDLQVLLGGCQPTRGSCTCKYTGEMIKTYNLQQNKCSHVHWQSAMYFGLFHYSKFMEAVSSKVLVCCYCESRSNGHMHFCLPSFIIKYLNWLLVFWNTKNTSTDVQYSSKPCLMQCTVTRNTLISKVLMSYTHYWF